MVKGQHPPGQHHPPTPPPPPPPHGQDPPDKIPLWTRSPGQHPSMDNTLDKTTIFKLTVSYKKKRVYTYIICENLI